MYVKKAEAADKMYVGVMLRSQGLEAEEALRFLPETGFLAWHEGFPVAAGYLRRVEGGYGWIDSLVTDATAPGASRNEALDLITTALVEEARRLELRGIIAFTKDQNTYSRAMKHGFCGQQFAVITKDLK